MLTHLHTNRIKSYINQSKQKLLFLQSQRFSLKVENAACATGAVFPFAYSSSHKHVQDALHDLKCFKHRGGEIVRHHEGQQLFIGDGAGVTTDIPINFFKEVLRSEAKFEFDQDSQQLGILHIFLPVEHAAKLDAVKQITKLLQDNGITIVNNYWRKVGFSGKAPELKISDFRQLFLVVDKQFNDFENTLQRIGIKIEYLSTRIEYLSLASISSKYVVYKGMLHSDEVGLFSDLQSPEFITNGFLLHTRQATNTAPKPGNAQPMSTIIHNGEFNSVQGNMIKRGLTAFQGWSDSRIFNLDVNTLLYEQGLSIEKAMTILMPPIYSGSDMAIKSMLEYFRMLDLAYCGPAHVVFQYDGTRGAKMDGCGLRPSRYSISEESSDISDSKVLKINSEDILYTYNAETRGLLGSGDMLILKDGNIKQSLDILTDLSKEYDYNDFMNERVVHIGITESPNKPSEKCIIPDMETHKYKLDSLLQGNLKTMAMGDDTSPLREQGEKNTDYHHLTGYFKQKFSQVTSPPLDSVKERNSFTLNTYLLNKRNLNIRPEDNENGFKIYTLDSPILRHGQYENLLNSAKDDFVVIDLCCNDLVNNWQNKLDEIEQIYNENNKKAFLILDDSKISESRLPIPDVVAVAFLNNLIRRAPESHGVPSIVVNSSQLFHPHHFSVLSAFGAAAVNPWNIYAYANNKFGDQYLKNCNNVAESIQEAHLKTMGKYGITSSTIYCGARLLEAISLDLSPSYDKYALGNVFEYLSSPIGGFGIQDLIWQHYNLSMSYFNQDKILNTKGNFSYAFEGLKHVYEPKVVMLIRLLTNRFKVFREEYSLAKINKDSLSKRTDISDQYKEVLKEKLLHLKEKLNENQKSYEDQELKYHSYAIKIKEFLKEYNIALSLESVVDINDEKLKYKIRNYSDALKYSQDNLKSLKKEYSQILQEINNTNFLIDYKEDDFEKITNILSRPYNLPSIDIDGMYNIDEINNYSVPPEFSEFLQKLYKHQNEYPASILHHLSITYLPENFNNVSYEDVESTSEILGRMSVGGISYGATTAPAHYSMYKAERMIRSRGACTGEGGELTYKDLIKYGIDDYEKSSIKQIASGRFGISAEFFSTIPENGSIEIKIAQGAKPGEGGQLPAQKVTLHIAKKRGCLPNTTLISPPPHHDIYSIEDLQQLIFDLKEARPDVLVTVKLCASVGIESVALGVAKSGADIINIASGSGGTGAAFLDSIKHCGMPSEVYLPIVHQNLLEAGIRNNVKLMVSGSIISPRDIIKLAVLGADYFEWGSTNMLLIGCDMLRKCNVPGACTPGITNNTDSFQGDWQDIAMYKLCVAAAVRAELYKMGYKSIREIRGNSGMLKIPDDSKFRLYDFEKLIKFQTYPEVSQMNNLKNNNNMNVYNLVEKQKDEGITDIQLDNVTLNIGNRTFGTYLSTKYVSELNSKKLKITIYSLGIVGQSFGFINSKNVILKHEGCAQDYVGKSATGGIISIKTPPNESKLWNKENVRGGNSVAYGAGASEHDFARIYINGQVGQRCGVLNKGALIVVEGTSDYACEYMTDGSFLSIRKMGNHFGCGMSGGIAVVNDDNIRDKISKDDVFILDAPERLEFIEEAKYILMKHKEHTNSLKAKQILDEWDRYVNKLSVVVPWSLWNKQKSGNLNEIKEIFKHKKISPLMKVFLRVYNKNQSDLIIDQTDIDRIMSAAINITNVATEPYYNSDERLYHGLGFPDEKLLVSSESLMDSQKDMNNLASRCTCDAVTCSGDRETEEPQETNGKDYILLAKTGCTLHKNPNLINYYLNKNDYESAFKIQIARSPFIGVTGAICPAPCQSSCTHMSVKDGQGNPVEIRRIELMFHNYALEHGLYDKFKVFAIDQQPIDRKVCVIGSGPAGMEAAYQLLKQGYQVDMYEKDSSPGGLLTYGIPDHKLPKEIVRYYYKELLGMGLNLHLENELTKSDVVNMASSYDYVLDARGISSQNRSLDEITKKSTYFDGGNHLTALDFLVYVNKFLAGEEKVNPVEYFNLENKIVYVLGAGDTAEDVLRTLCKLSVRIKQIKEMIDSDKSRMVLLDKYGYKPLFKIRTVDRQPEKLGFRPLGDAWPLQPELKSKLLFEDLTSNFVDSKAYFQYAPKGFEYDDNKITKLLLEKATTYKQGFAKGDRQVKTRNKVVEKKPDLVITAFGFDDKMDKLLNSENYYQIGDINIKQKYVVGAMASARKIVDKILKIDMQENIISNTDKIILPSEESLFNEIKSQNYDRL